MKFKFKEGEELVAQIYPSYGAYTIRFLVAFILASVGFLFLFWLLAQGILGTILFGTAIFVAFILVAGALKKRHNDVIIITNQRIVDIEKKGVFNKEVSELKYDQIDDVTVRQKGIVATVFRFGTLVIVGARGAMHLELEHVRSPMEVQDMILDLREQTLDEKQKQHPKHTAHERLYNMVHELKYLSRPELKRLKQSVDGRMEKYAKLKKSHKEEESQE